MSSPNCSDHSSLPSDACALQFKLGQNNRPNSSRQLFPTNEIQSSSEVSLLDQSISTMNTLVIDKVQKGSVNILSEKNVGMVAKKFISKMDDVFDRVLDAVNHLGHVHDVFVQQNRVLNNMSNEEQLLEIRNMPEQEIRELLEAQLIKGQQNERAIEQLWKRNHDLEERLNYAESHVMRLQVEAVDKAAKAVKEMLSTFDKREISLITELFDLKQKYGLLSAQNDSLQHQLTEANEKVEKMIMETREINKSRDLLRFECDSLQNCKRHMEKILSDTKNLVIDLEAQLKLTNEQLEIASQECSTHEYDISKLRDELKREKEDFRQRMVLFEKQVTKESDDYRAKTESRFIALKGEEDRKYAYALRDIKMKLQTADRQRAEAELRLIEVEKQRRNAEAKVVHYETNFEHIRGQVEGQAIRHMVGGCMSALASFPSTKKIEIEPVLNNVKSGILREIHPENVDTPSDQELSNGDVGDAQIRADKKKELRATQRMVSSRSGCYRTTYK